MVKQVIPDDRVPTGLVLAVDLIDVSSKDDIHIHEILIKEGHALADPF